MKNKARRKLIKRCIRLAQVCGRPEVAQRFELMARKVPAMHTDQAANCEQIVRSAEQQLGREAVEYMKSGKFVETLREVVRPFMDACAKTIANALRLQVDVQTENFPWKLINEAGNVIAEGLAYTFDELRAEQERRRVLVVLIDEGFRTLEVRLAAARFGWLTFKGRAGFAFNDWRAPSQP